MHIVRFFALLALICASAAQAQNLPETPGAARTVKMFDLFCFRLVPDLAAIAEVAQGNFDELHGEARRRYLPRGVEGDARVWRFSDFGHDYVLTTVRSEPDDALKSDVPDFAESTSIACSLVLPPQDPQGEILHQMVGLLEREPDNSWGQNDLRVSSWTGQTKEMHVNVFHYAPADGSPGGVLSAVTLVKN